MDVVSAPALRASSILWQGTTRVLTVVCKVTFALAPGESTLAADPESIHEHDTHEGDDPAKSIVAPSDLVPFKGRADVILVGNAYAPRGEPVRSLVVRMIIGELDKAIEVQHDRAWSHEGALHEGARFTSMPLAYERAAGGPETSNPVGVRADARPNTYGMVALPNLQPPGLQVSSRADAIAPVGFGPIAPAWPTRREKLGRHAATWNARTWHQAPLPRDIEPAYFNSAPRDQQIDELRIDERIILENLHRDVPRLVTRLPGVRPRAFVDLGNRGAAPEVALLCETLWIDTARSICTLTFRGHLENPPASGRVLVGLEHPGQRLTFADVEQQIRVEPERPRPERKIEESVASVASVAPPSTWNRAQTVTFVGSERSLGKPGAAVLPFGGSGAPKGRSAAADLLGEQSARGSEPPISTANETLEQRMRGVGQSSPSWLGAPPAAAPPSFAATPFAATPFGAPAAPPTPFVAPAPIAATPFAPPPVPPAPFVPAPSPSAPFVPQAPPSSGSFAVPPPAAAPAMVAPSRVQSESSPPPSSTPWSSGPESRAGVPAPMTVGQAAAQAASPVVIAASSAASAIAPPTPTPAPSESRQIWTGRALQLVWFDPESLPRVHRKEEWKPILRAVEERAPDTELDDPTIAKNPADVEDRRDMFEILSRGDALDEAALNRALERAVRDDGKFVPPLALVDGEVRFFFDELETLRATLTIAAVFSPGDEPLKAAIADAREFLRTPDMRSPPSVTEGYTTRIQEALKRAKRAPTPTYLDEQTERVLVEARHYQRRTVYGAPHLRAQIQMIGTSARAWPLYVPEPAATRLPMFARFTTRVLAEVGFQESQYEAHPSALRVLALARVTTLAGKTSAA